jgi:hypothetical protein
MAFSLLVIGPRRLRVTVGRDPRAVNILRRTLSVPTPATTPGPLGRSGKDHLGATGGRPLLGLAAGAAKGSLRASSVLSGPQACPLEPDAQGHRAIHGERTVLGQGWERYRS